MSLAIWVAAASLLFTSSSKPSAEIVDPEAYATERFQEIIEENQTPPSQSLQERLITQRAQLSIAEKKLNDLELALDEGNVNFTKVRAAEALVSHYRLKVQRLERKIRQRKTD